MKRGTLEKYVDLFRIEFSSNSNPLTLIFKLKKTKAVQMQTT